MARLFHSFCIPFSLIISVALGQYQVTNTNDDLAAGSLRWAINSANAASGAVIITFSTSVFSTSRTITLASALPAITKNDVTINGPGASLVTINGGNVYRVFLTNSGVTNIVMASLTIANGRSSYGGCIQNQGQLSLTGCVLSQCTATSGYGGAIYHTGETLAVDSCTFSGNAAGAGGAIFSDVGASTTISRSTFTANIGGPGNAIAIYTVSATVITDSTFYNNGQLDNGGAAIYSEGTTSIQRCTITVNYGTSNNGYSGGLYVAGGTTTIEKNIIYGNFGTGSDIRRGSGTITDNGYNIIGSSLGFIPALTNIGDDPLLGPLADNGGPTQTCALPPNSPAVNAGPIIPSGGSDIFDQRGAPYRRDQTTAQDIGAFELQFADLSVTKTVSLPSVPTGLPLTYTIMIKNYGPADAENVVLTDTLPAGVTFDSVTPPTEMQFSTAGGVVTGVREFLEAGTSITIHIIAIVTAAAGTTISNTVSVSTDSYDAIPINNQATADTLIISTGTGGGDPSFVGFMGQKFGFSGKANKSFHIFSDPYITINSRFAIANPSKGKGTVMYAFGIRWENHTITFGVDSLIKSNGGGNKDASLLISVDGIERTLPRSNQPTLFDNCINATWSFPKFRISTPLHKIVIDWRSEHNDHINGSYLNIRIDAPLDNPTLCGGVIGQTASAKNATFLSKRDSDFITSDDMISTEAKTSKFTARPMLCAAVATQSPSTAVAAHEHSGDTTPTVHIAHGMRV